jgi:hypothetical protein
MTRQTACALGVGVLLASALVVLGASSQGEPGSQHIRDSLEARVICDDYITLVLRDPSARTSSCRFDSAYSAIPGCRAISAVDRYNEMGNDDEFAEEDSSGATPPAAPPDTATSEWVAPPDSVTDTWGPRRFVVMNPQAGLWELEARVPASAGYIAATLWLNVRVVPSGKVAHVGFTQWAELVPDGRVRTKLRVGRDGSVALVGSVVRGRFDWSPTKERKP